MPEMPMQMTAPRAVGRPEPEDPCSEDPCSDDHAEERDAGKMVDVLGVEIHEAVGGPG
jgi:hypothetical protein